MSTDTKPLALVERFFEAYNSKDLDEVAKTLAPDVGVRHHNRGVDLTGRDATIDIMKQFEGIAPDRKFHAVRRKYECGDKVIFEHTWEATFGTEVEGFAAAGETVSLELCTVFTVRDGEIVEYDDYG